MNIESRSGKTWLAGAVSAAVIGGTVAVAFAVWWFAAVGGHCGVVRFYEQAFGVIIAGGWLAGTAVGLLLAFIGRRRSVKAAVVGSIIAILVNIVTVAVCAKVVHGVREGDYTLKSTEHLVGLLAGKGLDARVLSANALGERRAVEALAPLCAILDDAGEDINLRHNAAIALGRPRVGDSGTLAPFLPQVFCGEETAAGRSDPHVRPPLMIPPVPAMTP